MLPKSLKFTLLAVVASVWQTVPAGQVDVAALKPVVEQSAQRVQVPANSMILAATRAGHRLVLVGSLGTILLSNDQGKTYRQASVPVRLQVTAVQFIDDKQGWATGHAGLILHTTDGGEHWTIQHLELNVDQPLFSVHFRNANEGWAVGLWSLMLHTTDGGSTWSAIQLPPPTGAKKADLNLFSVFDDGRNGLFVSCEKGYVLHSVDGVSWQYLETGYRGSLWTGVAWPDGHLLVGGLRGSLLSSDDAGQHWTTVDLGQTSSITSLRAAGDRVIGVGLEGLQMVSLDRGAHFKLSRREDRIPLTAVVNTGADGVLEYSSLGIPPDNRFAFPAAP